MSRKTEVFRRRDFDIIVADMDADLADQLKDELLQWDGGADCPYVEVTVDSMERLDGESSPRPA